MSNASVSKGTFSEGPRDRKSSTEILFRSSGSKGDPGKTRASRKGSLCSEADRPGLQGPPDARPKVCRLTDPSCHPRSPCKAKVLPVVPRTRNRESQNRVSCFAPCQPRGLNLSTLSVVLLMLVDGASANLNQSKLGVASIYAPKISSSSVEQSWTPICRNGAVQLR